MSRFRFLALSALLPLILLLVGATREATWTRHVVLQPGSQLWIEGSSTVNRFRCDAEAMTGFGMLDGADEATARVVVPVEDFECGKRQMNRDLYEAMDAKAHPTITYELTEAHLLTPADTTPMQVYTAGILTIAGTARTITMTVEGYRLPEGGYRAVGAHPLSMRDFGIEPPTALFGLIKARDRIVVHFDLRAGFDTTTAAAVPLTH